MIFQYALLIFQQVHLRFVPEIPTRAKEKPRTGAGEVCGGCGGFRGVLGGCGGLWGDRGGGGRRGRQVGRSGGKSRRRAVGRPLRGNAPCAGSFLDGARVWGKPPL